VVGDDDQSIYSWRGAEVRNILGFDKDFPKAKVIRLEENYRSCPNILKLANQLIRCNTERHPKELCAVRPSCDVPRFAKYIDETAEAEAVARDIQAIHVKDKVPFRDIAVLFRTNEQPRLFEQEFRARNIPYVLVGSYSFFDRKEIRDILSYLRVLANPKDEVNLLRVINVPARGISESVQEKLLQHATQQGASLWDIIPEMVRANTLSSKATAGLNSLVQLIQEY